MNVRFRLGVLLVELVAVLGAASPAMAKGGTGGGGGGAGGGGATAPGCAVIQSWTNTLTTSATGQPFVTMTFGVDNQCVDEFGASRAMVELDTYDTATGKWLTGFGQGLNLGLHYFTYGEPYVPADQRPGPGQPHGHLRPAHADGAAGRLTPSLPERAVVRPTSDGATDVASQKVPPVAERVGRQRKSRRLR
jgi:hypothetical protein